MRRKTDRERGQAVVEVALILPLLLVLVFGMIEFGRALNYWIDMTHLANEGARYATVNRWPTCPSDDATGCPETLQSYLLQRVNTDELQDGTGNVTSPLAVEICFPEGASDPGKAVRVKVDASYRLAVVDGIFGAIGLDTLGEIDMSASSTQRLERRPTAARLLAETSPCS